MRPASSYEVLRKRVDRLLSPSARNISQTDLFHSHRGMGWLEKNKPIVSSKDFLDFLAATIPNGDIYLFGGVLRDLALYGKEGFNSDIDIVVTEDWQIARDFLCNRGARLNKFGGFRLTIGSQPIDIWNAEDTWAFKHTTIPYNGISSLTETTVLNWDGILMNWRSKFFVARDNYLQSLRERTLDVVLLENPNPLGMAVRVFRHLCSKDAKRVTARAVQYLYTAASSYSTKQLIDSELSSYQESLIEPEIVSYFRDRAWSVASTSEINEYEIKWKQIPLFN